MNHLTFEFLHGLNLPKALHTRTLQQFSFWCARQAMEDCYQNDLTVSRRAWICLLRAWHHLNGQTTGTRKLERTGQRLASDLRDALANGIGYDGGRLEAVSNTNKALELAARACASTNLVELASICSSASEAAGAATVYAAYAGRGLGAIAPAVHRARLGQLKVLERIAMKVVGEGSQGLDWRPECTIAEDWYAI
jgi:hypothetical protein